MYAKSMIKMDGESMLIVCVSIDGNRPREIRVKIKDLSETLLDWLASGYTIQYIQTIRGKK